MLRPATEDWESLSLGSLIKDHELFILKRAITRLIKTRPGGCSEFKSNELSFTEPVSAAATDGSFTIQEVFRIS